MMMTCFLKYIRKQGNFYSLSTIQRLILSSHSSLCFIWIFYHSLNNWLRLQVTCGSDPCKMLELKEMRCCYCMSSDRESSSVQTKDLLIQKKPKRRILETMIIKLRTSQESKERERRLNMVVVLSLILLLVSTIISFFFLISTLCIHLSFKNTIYASQQSIEGIRRISMEQKSKIKKNLSMLKKKADMMKKRLWYLLEMQPPKTQFFQTSWEILWWKEGWSSNRWSKRKIQLSTNSWILGKQLWNWPQIVCMDA